MILIYALGGGWGHLTRAAALARAASASGRAIRILTNSPHSAQVRRALPGVDIVALDPALPIEAARTQAIRAIEAAAPNCLVVDTFPRGLGGELADLLGSLRAFRMLVHRDLNPRYVQSAGLREFVASAYDSIVLPGEGEAFSGLPAVIETAPWLIRSSGELPAREEARRLLGIAHYGRPCILVCAAGNPEELDWYRAVVSCLEAIRPSIEVAAVGPPGGRRDTWLLHWPVMDVFPGADAVVGGAGYNTIHECAAVGVPLISKPWPRKYDRQRLRAERAARAGSVRIAETPAEAARAACEAACSHRPVRRDYPNGAREAAQLLASVV